MFLSLQYNANSDGFIDSNFYCPLSRHEWACTLYEQKKTVVSLPDQSFLDVGASKSVKRQFCEA